MKTPTLPDQIDALLPQTQCRQCGYDGCRPYAEAIARGEAEINQCPPGGDAGIAKLAHLLQRAPIPLNPKNGVHKPRHVAIIDEAVCIGCTRCIQACPVDAILGATKHMHTVIADECTGCELCIPPCPVDCIRMAPAPFASSEEQHDHADRARRRFQFRTMRLARLDRERQARHRAKLATALLDAETESKRAAIRAAVERVRARRTPQSR